MANKIHFLNTIWSDCILLESNNKFAFIDTGKNIYWPMIDQYLQKLNIKELEFIFLTHFHNDHYGCIEYILPKYKVKKVYFRDYSDHDGSTGDGTVSTDEYHKAEREKANYLMDLSKQYSNLIMIDESLDYVGFGDWKLELYAKKELIRKAYEDVNGPYYHINKFNENYDCVSLYANLNGVNIFFGGDVPDISNDISDMDMINTKTIKYLKEKNHIDHFDIYKACHHGVHDGTSRSLALLLKPDYTIITNSDRWLDKYKTYSYLNEANPNMTILKTDFNQYVFEISKDGKIVYSTCPYMSYFDELDKIEEYNKSKK